MYYRNDPSEYSLNSSLHLAGFIFGLGHRRVQWVV